ncbi:hypothetical protein [Streptococcus respiraculi]|uniref:hypothetical protein n=1 Tax=Streptococcus respiraculi TaxID=2021971 RepID=UPI0013C4941C|nr:hypothetical protein [Streptococcus respiraculi]
MIEQEMMVLNEADLHAIELADVDYLLNKGASFYHEENYTLAVEYYRLRYC